MTSRESLDERMGRWRRALDDVEPPAGLSERIVARVLAHASHPRWTDLVVAYGRRGIAAAALAAAVATLLATSSGSVDELDAEASMMEVSL